MRWLEKYIKVPFLIDGRSMNGCDCWGLYRLIVKERSGIDLPMYPEQTTLSHMRKMLEKSQSPEWKIIQAGSEVELDCVLMRGQFTHEGKLRSRPIHVGCVLGAGLLIHTEQGVGTTIVGYRNSSLIKNRIVGFYRYDANLVGSSQT